jgi:methyl-accepting chemotaxis protein
MNNRKLIILAICISLITAGIIVFLFVEPILVPLARRLYIAVMGIFCVSALIWFFRIYKKQDKKAALNKTALQNIFNQSIDLLEKSADFFIRTVSFINSIYPERNAAGENKPEYNLKPLNTEPDMIVKVKMLSEIIRLYISRLVNFTGFDSAKNSAELSGTKELIGKIIIHLQLSAEIINSFIVSIIGNLNKTSEPLSKSILETKKELSDFLENISGWNDEFTREGSDKNFNAIINTYTTQNNEFKDIVSGINQSYISLDKNLKEINQKMEKIGNISEIITDISEKIHILSINASIESARAGESGKGFKIISNEVKQLSGNTQKSVTEIVPITNLANKIVLNTLNEFNSGRSEIISMLEKQNREFNSFYNMLNSYYTEITNMLRTTSSVIKGIQGQIDKLVPIFQESNLTVQELENLKHMVTDFVQKYQADFARFIESIPRQQVNELARMILTDIKRQTT